MYLHSVCFVLLAVINVNGHFHDFRESAAKSGSDAGTADPSRIEMTTTFALHVEREMD